MMARGKNPWRASSVPGIRGRVQQAAMTEVRRLEALAIRAEQAGNHATARGLRQSIIGQAHVVTSLGPDTMMVWVADPMARVAVDASQDVPSLEAGDVPAPLGMLVFERPLPPVDVQGVGGLALRDNIRTDIMHTDPVPVDAIMWDATGDSLWVQMMCREGRLPLPLQPNEADLVPFMEIEAPLPVVFDEVQAVRRDGTMIDGPMNVGVMAFLASAWTLMMAPGVAARSQIDARTGQVPRESTSIPPQRLVTVVDLRPMRAVNDTDDSAASGRKVTKRFIVRGHWTNQVYGRARALRRKQWIESYIKGPSNAPLEVSEMVYRWRR